MTEPVRHRRGTVILLAVAVGLLTVAVGLLGTLYVMQRGDTDEVNQQVATAERELADANDRLAANMSTLDEQDQEREELEDTATALHACADPTAASIEAVRAGDDAALSNALDLMFANCGR